MGIMHALWLFVCLVAPFTAAAANGGPTPVSFIASDNVTIFADYYGGRDAGRPLILLFHQAGSNRAEYAPIAPMLTTLGFDALAIDQRSGGSLWGRANETVQHLGRSEDYDAALHDLEAALVWAKSSGRSGPVIVWGSSYSAALVFLLAAKHPQDVKALLAFSPGEYLAGASSVRSAAAQLSIPIFVTSAKESGEVAQAKAILDAAPARQKVQFVPHIAGVHGSSTLRSDRNPKGAEENWAAVKAFLASLAL
ncbi:MAG TPA: alpha/beta fold hydrolase [Xanthobacteraceae bacterium]|jgi:dienelactone hydrolase|nr:alpha/beta fold hydrolase [Xanthobacteraceae bacterium]